MKLMVIDGNSIINRAFYGVRIRFDQIRKLIEYHKPAAAIMFCAICALLLTPRDAT